MNDLTAIRYCHNCVPLRRYSVPNNTVLFTLSSHLRDRKICEEIKNQHRMRKPCAGSYNTSPKSTATSPNGVYKNLEAQLEKVLRQSKQDLPKEISIQTRYRYYESMKKFLSFCAEKFRLQKIQKISNKHLEAYIKYRQENNITPKVIKQDLSGIRFFHRFSGSKIHLAPNKRFNLEATPPNNTDRAWTVNEYNKMLQIAHDLRRKDVIVAMHLAYHLGLRIHKCTRLTHEQIERAVEIGSIAVKGKGGKVRSVPLSSRTKKLLLWVSRELFYNEKAVLVAAEQKTHLAIKKIQSFIYRHRSKVVEKDKETKITLHGLRHLYAQEKYYEYLKTLSPHKARLAVAELLGHNRDEITLVYLPLEAKK